MSVADAQAQNLGADGRALRPAAGEPARQLGPAVNVNVWPWRARLASSFLPDVESEGERRQMLHAGLKTSTL